MSYFVAISGEHASSISPGRGRFVPASETQDYFRSIAQRIASATGRPVVLWDDSETDTSDDLVCEACDEIQLLGKDFPESAFASMLSTCEETGCRLYVWWPSHLQVIGGLDALPVTTSAADALMLFVSQASRGTYIGFVLQPN
jgi:hypothetical protein